MPDKKPVCIITGASSGIGAALAEEAARRGYRLSLSARNTANLHEVGQSCRALGAEVLEVSADVASEADCRRLIHETVSHFGQIDVLINNAGISMRALLRDLHTDVLRQVMDTNFWGTVYCTHAALPYLLERKGSVVGISSIAGFKGLPGRTGYSASKFAMHGFLEALRCENLKTGLHVLIACPGYTASNIRKTALNADGHAQGETPRDEARMMQPDEVARIVIDAIKQKRMYAVMS
ncbi:MAG: SDR family oxidoreductase, partial [Bacteroidetes bacterium]|nr:SDR family oxidoreductase [Bacteroidota bacterium]